MIDKFIVKQDQEVIEKVNEYSRKKHRILRSSIHVVSLIF